MALKLIDSRIFTEEFLTGAVAYIKKCITVRNGCQPLQIVVVVTYSE
jgi:hypothetical protein